MNADAVFEGGGVKGIGLVGAVCRLEEAGYRWQRFAGTSAGAIVAALLAAGYTGKELKKIIMNFDYTKFRDKDKLQSIPLVGSLLGLLIEKGVHCGDTLEDWLSNILRARGKIKFRDVSINGESRLKVVATDITKKELLILPDDLERYGLDPLEFEISKAVRMSISIPFYFKPMKLIGKDGISYIVDGGVLSNFPVWIFDVEGIPRWPTFGFKLVEPEKSYTGSGKTDALSFLLDLAGTMLSQNESRYIKNKDMIRTIPIPTLGVETTDFDITSDKSLELFNSGYKSAGDFIDNWDFSGYVKKYRAKKCSSRVKSLWAD